MRIRYRSVARAFGVLAAQSSAGGAGRVGWPGRRWSARRRTGRRARRWCTRRPGSSATRCASWRGLSLGCLPRSRPLALATRMPSRVRSRMRSASNSATMASTLNSSRPTGSVGSCTEPPRLSLTWRCGQLVDDVARVGQRAGEPVEFGDDQRVAVAAGGQRLAQAGTFAVGAGQAVVDVDPVGADAERGEGFALRGQVLLVGGHAGVADQQRRHEASPHARAGATTRGRDGSCVPATVPRRQRCFRRAFSRPASATARSSAAPADRSLARQRPSRYGRVGGPCRRTQQV